MNLNDTASHSDESHQAVFRSSEWQRSEILRLASELMIDENGGAANVGCTFTMKVVCQLLPVETQHSPTSSAD